jgi:hypothetical protein
MKAVLSVDSLSLWLDGFVDFGKPYWLLSLLVLDGRGFGAGPGLHLVGHGISKSGLCGPDRCIKVDDGSVSSVRGVLVNLEELKGELAKSGCRCGKVELYWSRDSGLAIKDSCGNSSLLTRYEVRSDG